jgi:hypothetical protein
MNHSSKTDYTHEKKRSLHRQCYWHSNQASAKQETKKTITINAVARALPIGMKNPLMNK